MDYTEKCLHCEQKYKGLIVDVSVDSILLPNGGGAVREIVTHPGGVTIIPIDDDGYAYCVRQYRYAIGEELLETPAGKLEPGEDPKLCAVRELSEETGIHAGRITFLGEIYPSPGFCREVLYAYMARDLSFGLAHPDENELLHVERVHLDELTNLIMRGDLKDAKTIIAVLKARNLLEAENGKNRTYS